METNFQTRTEEDIKQLKANWLKDPCWDIEDTPGFEAHREELEAYRKTVESMEEALREEREARRTIRTIVTRVYANGAVSMHQEDDEISKLMLQGWQAMNVSMVQFTDNGGDWPVVVIERVVTLVRSPLQITGKLSPKGF